MPGRRSNGEGNIRQRPDGHWEASQTLNGRRYWVRGRTEHEVRAKLTELRRQHYTGDLVAPSKLSLGQFLDQWLEVGAADWKPKTLYSYRVIVNVYWKPALGHVRLQQLTPPMIGACYTRWRAGRSGGTLLNVHRCLHRALQTAVRWGA